MIHFGGQRAGVGGRGRLIFGEYEGAMRGDNRLREHRFALFAPSSSVSY